MFELSVAFKYLVPRWRQISVSIISIISILVIALVVWLIVVFFSVTHGLEKGWTQKLITLTAPVRILPTDAYYNSYYYQIDSLSSASDYSYKSIAEKLESEITDPYDPTMDEEIPASWPAPIKNQDGSVKDIVKTTFDSINSLKGVSAKDFEITFANLRLRLLRNLEGTPTSVSQAIWLASFDPSMQRTVMPVRNEDLQNVLNMLAISTENIREDTPQSNQKVAAPNFQEFLEHVQITQLQTPTSGWFLPKSFLPKAASWQVSAVMQGGKVSRIVIPKNAKTLSSLKSELELLGFEINTGPLRIEDGKLFFKDNQLPKSTPLILESKVVMDAQLVHDSLQTAKQASSIQFNVSFTIQSTPLVGKTSLGPLAIAKTKGALDSELADDGILLPKSFKDAGVLVGDRGYISYNVPTASTFQEQRIPVNVKGFYDPGIIPIGGKLVLANQELTSLLRAAFLQEDKVMGTGINVRFDNLEKADEIKSQLQRRFKEQGVDRYWTIETYKEYDFTKDIIQQLKSEKNLFTLISTVIIIVACSNIISMLIILVNDKKTEIGILRSMGATSSSIALIFGTCGVIMGLVGSLLGTVMAIFTLKHLATLIQLISTLQGHEMFNANFYGDTIPNELSWEALSFVLISTVAISLLAGIVPAVKASLLKPSAILRAE